MNLKRLFLYSLIASVAFSAFVGIGVILLGDFGELEIRVLLTTLTVTVTSIAGLACGAYYETGRGRELPAIGIFISLIAAILVTFIIWGAIGDNTIYIKTTITAAMLAASISHLSLLSLARLDKRFAWSRIAAFLLIASLALILLFILWFEPQSDNGLVSRTIGILSILIASVTVITPVFHKLSAKEDDESAIDTEIANLQKKIFELEAQKVSLGITNSRADQ